MNKVVRDGKVAVLYSPGYGAGWYTWNQIRMSDGEDPKTLIFDPILVELVEKRDHTNFHDFTNRIEQRAEELVPSGYFGGASDLKIEWLPVGTAFLINEYDGSESVQTLAHLELIA